MDQEKYTTAPVLCTQALYKPKGKTMKLQEQEVLKKIFWPSEKEALLGNMVFFSANEDFSSQEISVSRNANTFEVFFSNSLPFEKEKQYFVKMIFDRVGEEIVLDKVKTSPELKTDQDITDTLDSIQNNILKMNTKPTFFPTGVAKKPTSKNTI